MSTTPTTPIPFSVVLIVKNEAHTLERCLTSVSWADEIVVVDGGSDDGTLQLCRASGRPWSSKIRVCERAWTGFKDQRNFAMDRASNDWVLVIDADEACSPELASRIQGLLALPGGPPLRAYKVQRYEYFLGKQIRHGIWNPSYQDRFFHRAGVRYVNDVHEYPVFPVQPGRIHEPLLHWQDFTPEKFLAKMNKYTTIEALDRYQGGKRTNPFHLLLTFPAMAAKMYFYYGGYKDGYHGFIIALLEGISRTVRHIKIWQLQLEEKAKH